MDRRSFLLGGLCSCALGAPAVGQQPSFRRSLPDRASFFAAGLRCGTGSPSTYEKQRLRRALAALQARSITVQGSVLVPVRFNILHDGDIGRLSQKQIEDQLHVMNAAFRPANVQFAIDDISFHNRPDWFYMSKFENAELEARTALLRDPERLLNFFSADIDNLGVASFPWDLAKDPFWDGVVVAYDCFPGGTWQDYNLGMTAVHEAGHWLGLFHTFEGGCSVIGDAIGDTPAEAEAAYGCKIGRDTCPDWHDTGPDPVQNYMDYSDDACMTHFTPGQNGNMRLMTAIYRTALLDDRALVSTNPSATVGRQVLIDLRKAIR